MDLFSIFVLVVFISVPGIAQDIFPRQAAFASNFIHNTYYTIQTFSCNCNSFGGCSFIGTGWSMGRSRRARFSNSQARRNNWTSGYWNNHFDIYRRHNLGANDRTYWSVYLDIDHHSIHGNSIWNIHLNIYFHLQFCKHANWRCSIGQHCDRHDTIGLVSKNLR